MNVAFDPWIPVVSTSGKRELASLCTVLAEGGRFADLAVRPHERVALMRLFLCIAHTALEGPKDYDEWLEAPNRLPEAVNKYLKNWRDSFELFHEKKPWLQVAELKEVKKEKKVKKGKEENEKSGNESGKTSPVTLLDFELATGNNSTLNDHGGQRIFREIEPERLALNLLTFQNFSPGGGSPIAQWKTKITSQVGNPDAPCLSQSMAHCLFRGKSLAETLHLNLPTFETIGKVYKAFSPEKKKDSSYSDLSLGKPVWEIFPESPESDADRIQNATRTYIGRLVPISRWIHLIQSSDQMHCCNGFKYDTYKDGFPSEPTSAVRLVTTKDKKGAQSRERRVVKVDPSKALWRELSSLLVKRSADGLGGPLAMENAPRDTEFDFHVCAMTRAQASMDIAVESVFHITPAFQGNFPIYQAEVMKAEDSSRKLCWAIEDYRSVLDTDWKPRVKRTQAKNQAALKNRLAQTALLTYWTTIEKKLPLLMTHIESVGTDAAIPTRDAWRKMLFSTACEAYNVACGQETPRQMRAFVKGLQKLTNMKKRPESDTTKIKEVNDELAS